MMGWLMFAYQKVNICLFEGSWGSLPEIWVGAKLRSKNPTK